MPSVKNVNKSLFFINLLRVVSVGKSWQFDLNLHCKNLPPLRRINIFQVQLGLYISISISYKTSLGRTKLHR